jgi:hypothetical protein
VDVPALLATGGQGWDVSLHVAGDRCYVLGERTVACYGLKDATEQWRWESVAEAHFERMMKGADFIAVLDRREKGPAGMLCFSREIIPGGQESGLLRASVVLPAGEDWTGVEGGVYWVRGGEARGWRGRR